TPPGPSSVLARPPSGWSCGRWPHRSGFGAPGHRSASSGRPPGAWPHRGARAHPLPLALGLLQDQRSRPDDALCEIPVYFQHLAWEDDGDGFRAIVWQHRLRGLERPTDGVLVRRFPAVDFLAGKGLPALLRLGCVAILNSVRHPCTPVEGGHVVPLPPLAYRAGPRRTIGAPLPPGGQVPC